MSKSAYISTLRRKSILRVGSSAWILEKLGFSRFRILQGNNGPKRTVSTAPVNDSFTMKLCSHIVWIEPFQLLCPTGRWRHVRWRHELVDYDSFSRFELRAVPCSEKLSYFVTVLSINYASWIIFPENRRGFATKLIPHKILETF